MPAVEIILAQFGLLREITGATRRQSKLNREIIEKSALAGRRLYPGVNLLVACSFSEQVEGFDGTHYDFN
jgi:hypothetical protein